MGWREDMIEHYTQMRDRYQQGIDMMRAGKLELRSLEDGKWVNINDSTIARDETIIATLNGIIERAKAEVG
ncbi:hypothetical protein LB565_16350 [Mesorhizobium sp. CA14]|uniref:hypothetical protein n=1 Tax=Mesorhizobium sp. CA14 TaxID=2876642 RepID=UPI001CCA7B09|nr:hypothetical protein [Mesorhizobium sp. CA14]MBZ9849556.1 hypothetical protein [Mesorhizobium sp. CA14]